MLLGASLISTLMLPTIPLGKDTLNISVPEATALTLLPLIVVRELVDVSVALSATFTVIVLPT